MDTSKNIVLLAIGIVLVICSLLLRILSGGKYEIKTTDLVFLVIPLLIVAFATGKLKGFDIFGIKADLSTLWTEAAQTDIQGQVAPVASAALQDVVHVVEMANKGGVEELQRLTEHKIEALAFKLGQGGYYGPAIKTYFEALSGSSNLRIIVVNEPNGTLFGIYNASDLTGYLRVAGEPGYSQLQYLLNSGSGNEKARVELTKLPGFINADHAVVASMSKRDALLRMEQFNTDILPVVDMQRHFIGTVRRANLTASLILAVSDKLEGR